MTAYVIVDIKVTDRSKFKEYAKAVQSTVKAFGGRYICKWGLPETLEGEWDGRRIVIVEFETLSQAQNGGLQKNIAHSKHFGESLQQQG